MFSTGIVRYCIRGMLSRECRASLTKFLQLLEEAYGPPLDMENFESFEKRRHEAVCMIERDFPVLFQVSQYIYPWPLILVKWWKRWNKCLSCSSSTMSPFLSSQFFVYKWQKKKKLYYFLSLFCYCIKLSGCIMLKPHRWCND